MNLREALDSYATIRQRMAQTEVFPLAMALPFGFGQLLAAGVL